MKKSLIVFLSLACFFQLGCDSGFEAANFAINLEYPEPNSKCEKGIETENSFVIPFEWTPQGNLTDYKLILNDEPIIINPADIEKNENQLIFRYPVSYNTAYTWRIESSEITSNSDFFRTPIPGQEINNVPLAVTFGTPTFRGNSDSKTITFTWEGRDNDNDGSLRYDAYIGTSSDISTSNNSGQQTNLTSATVEFTLPNFDSNSYYYLLVVAKDNVNEAYSILKFKEF